MKKEDIGVKIMEYLEQQLPVLTAFVLKVLICLLVYFVGKKVIAWLVKTTKNILIRGKVQEGAITFILSMVKILLYTVLVLSIAMEFGLKESSIAAAVASAGVAIGLALQGGLSNFAGGFLILLFQPFHVGDYIITQGEEGTVMKIEILYTTLYTTDNRKVIVPNGNLANNIMVNVTAEEKRKLEIRVGISYEDDIKVAKGVLERLLQENPLVLHEEEMVVFVADLADSSVILGLRCWVETSNYFPVRWELNEKIKNEFDQAGIHIPYPQLDVHVKTNNQCKD